MGRGQVVQTHGLESSHSFAGELSCDGVVGVRLGEEDERGRWRNISPVQEVVELGREEGSKGAGEEGRREEGRKGGGEEGRRGGREEGRRGGGEEGRRGGGEEGRRGGGEAGRRGGGEEGRRGGGEEGRGEGGRGEGGKKISSSNGAKCKGEWVCRNGKDKRYFSHNIMTHLRSILHNIFLLC